jgi:hypothetical protein
LINFINPSEKDSLIYPLEETKGEKQLLMDPHRSSWVLGSKRIHDPLYWKENNFVKRVNEYILPFLGQ